MKDLRGLSSEAKRWARAGHDLDTTNQDGTVNVWCCGAWMRWDVGLDAFSCPSCLDVYVPPVKSDRLAERGSPSKGEARTAKLRPQTGRSVAGRPARTGRSALDVRGFS